MTLDIDKLDLDDSEMMSQEAHDLMGNEDKVEKPTQTFNLYQDLIMHPKFILSFQPRMIEHYESDEEKNDSGPMMVEALNMDDLML